MNFVPTPVKDAFEIILSPLQDERGVFSRIFCQDEMKKIGISKNIVQINHSLNKKKGTIRGMHFQYPPHAETKIIRCIKGKVYDVLVDLRKGSDTFLKWHSIELSPDKYNMIVIPEGCAHGFQTLEEDSELLYFHTEFYMPKSEGAIRFDDPLLNIHWPLPAVNISAKDKNYPLLHPSFEGIAI